MPTTDPRVDAYIAKSATFAQPVLRHLRRVVHAACPAAEETIKWGFPHFVHRGNLCAMAAFKAHCAFHFWLGEQVLGGKTGAEDEAMGQFGRIGAIADLPSERELTRLVKKAAALNEAGGRRTDGRPKRSRPEAPVPDDLAAALKKNAAARRTFEAFSPSHRREYLEWITEAKRPETRARRLATTLEWLAAGKARNWKYDKC